MASDSEVAVGRSTASRPDVQEIKNVYDHIFHSAQPISKIKDAALRGRLFSDKAEKSLDHEGDGGSHGYVKDAGVVGRSLAWKVFLIQTEPLQPTTTDALAIPPLEALKRSRQEYQRLLLERMRAPDGSYEDGFIIPGTGRSPPRTQPLDKNLELNNPLSLHDENPWTAWFASMDMRKEILQDVERTFPDIGYFRDSEVQTQLTNVLFLYSVTHPDVGYRQGMHELLASLYYAVDFDSISSSAAASPVEEFCSRVWVAADAWTLFSSVMRGVGRWYEWRESKIANFPDGTVTTPTSTNGSGKNPLASHVHFNLDGGSGMGMQPYVAPIVETCNRIQSVFLKSVDPPLWKSLQASGIEPQMYGIRWLRLLFTREFSMDDAMTMWDGLFACDPSFELAPWICVAMLIRIRNNLIPEDYSTQLTYLLRYPSSSATSPPIHPCILLLRQALTLQMSPTPATGASVVNENYNLLNISPEVPESPPPPTFRRRPGPVNTRGQSLSTSEAGPSRGLTTPDVGRSHFRQGSQPTMGIPEMIARGLLERGESLGINKTVMNAVSELKRNLPDLATTLQRLPTPMTPQTSSYAAYPLVDEKPPTERPPWEPKTRFEMERDITQLQTLQRRLGDSVGWIVDTLLLDEGNQAEMSGEQTNPIRELKREALESLSYVRDILKGIVPLGQVENDRLQSEDELKRRKEKAKKEAENKTAASELARHSSELSPPDHIHATLTPPKPAAVSLPPFLAHPSASSAPPRRSQDYFTIGTSVPRSPPQAAPLAVSASQNARQKSSSPTPTMNSVLSPNKNGMPLAPWNYTPSTFSSRDSPLANLPRMPSRPSAVASPRQHSALRITPSYPGTIATPQTPSQSDQPPPITRRQQQDPLGVLP